MDFYREKGWKKGVVVLPTGTGKTYLAAFDAKKFNGRVLYIVHRLDILKQTMNTFKKVWSEASQGILTGEIKDNIFNSRVLFASKDSLRNPEYLKLFSPDTFEYIIVDEVHHGQAPTYRSIIKYFEPPGFLLGVTATPDRMDRKDIFELFDYCKVFEYTIQEAIEDGLLVPFTYYGLKDNIDYSNIRYNGVKYNVQDLDRYLIIEERNKQILKEYLDKGKGDKAIGFCCSINHANRMAEFFNKHGIPAVAITSETEDREKKIQEFRENKYAVAFTVDLFNEGIDFPEVRVLMFLRPTESKTVFLQQLGRGLRLCSGKDRVVVLDFIGNYKKANKIRQYLAKSRTPQKDSRGRIEKYVYEYSPGCEVYFEAEVEEILDRQDLEEKGISKEDLIAAYYELAEKLGRKPTPEDINREGEFKISRYLHVFESWIRFLREIGEYTESSYHYPQGLHLGHILYILKVLAEGKREGTHLDNRFIRLRGNLDSGRLGTFQRQTKYKLQGMMEMGLIVDDREFGSEEDYSIELTPTGLKVYNILEPLIQSIDLSFKDKNNDDNVPTWDMKLNPVEFNRKIWDFIKNDKHKRDYIRKVFLSVHAVSQMLNYLYKIERKETILKSDIYKGFFKAPFVEMFCEQNGIDIATEEGARHRCPFLLNILEAIGLIEQNRSEVIVKKFLICEQTMKLKYRESEKEVIERIEMVEQYLLGKSVEIPPDELSLLKENFGKEFLTDKYYLNGKYEVLITSGSKDYAK